MKRLILHVDMDAFFAAIEQRDRPELRGKPVIVGAQPGGRGVVSTCSYEARKFGIHSAMPISVAHRRCPHGIYLRPDFKRYAEASGRLMEVLETISPVVEPVSIDEAYVDITGLKRLFGPPEAIGDLTRRRIRDALGVTASVGIGPNRVIAKIASDQRKPDGLTVVPADQVTAFLGPLPVGTLRGVGGETQKVLHRMGIQRVRDLQGWELSELQARLGRRHGLALFRQARGEASDQVGGEWVRKSISKENTFGEDVDDPETVRDTLFQLSREVGRLARDKGFYGRVITLKIRLDGFETHTRQRRLDRSTQADLTIFRTGWGLYRESPFVKRPVRLIGIGMSGLETESTRPGGLFDCAPPAQDDRLYKVLDEITRRHGREVITLGKRRGKS